MFIIAFLIVFLIYEGINYWIGLRAWQGLFRYLSHSVKWRSLYWIFFTLIASSYILERFVQDYLPANLNRAIAYIGVYWLAVMFYGILFLLLFEFLNIVNRSAHIIPPNITVRPSFHITMSILIIVSVTGILGYGTWNAQNPRIQHYDLQIDKETPNLETLHVVMVSDIHLGIINQNKMLNGLITRVNSLNPDIIVFTGDVLDDNVEVFGEQKMAIPFQSLKAPYGIYAVLGNHEYISNHPEEAIQHLEEAGIKVLRDQMVEISGSFNLVGRDDLSSTRFKGQKRADLTTLLRNSNLKLPVIVLDHQPSHLEEPEQAGVDLQLSGHTHRGQLWPAQWITGRLFEMDWGILQKGPFHLIVSEGYGTWGPPMRIGNQPEIVDIQIQFRP